MKILLRLTKYLFVLTIAIFIIIVFIFVYYSQKIDFKLPEMVDVKIYDSENKVFLTLNNENKQSYIKLEDISQNIIDCIISVEDKKFYSHKGIDLVRIGGALIKNIKANDIKEGASTITQQYARMLYLTTEQNVKRKTEEILIAMNLERKYTKDEILEGYLNTIYFDHGIYGVNDACKFYFNKTASEVSLAEAAIIASIPKGPVYYSPLKNYERNKARKELIIDEVLKDGKISYSQAQEAKNEDVKFYGKIATTDSNYAPYYQDLIIRELKSLHILENFKAKELHVYTNLDMCLNQIMLEALNKYAPNNDKQQVALFAMNPQNGHVLSVIGGRNYQDSAYNRATDAIRQPGSTIKPFLYYAALNNGFTPITTFKSSPTDFYYDGKVYSPSNFNDIYPNRDVTMAYAIATSDNIYAVKTHLFLGTSVLYNTLINFGFTTKIHNTPSLALGTSEVKLSELTTGYGRIANLGRDISPIYINKITDEEGNVLYENHDKAKQVYNKTNCYILAQTMTNVFDNNLRINISATGAPIANMLSHRYAAKTGTTDTDSLILGFNNEIVLGIWTGYDDNSPLENSDAKFIKFLWAEIVEKYMEEIKGDGWYKWEDDVITIKLNPVTGQLASEGEYAKELFFDVNNIPWYLFDNLDQKATRNE